MLTNRRKKNLSDDQLIDNYKKTGQKLWVGELWNRYAHLIYGVCLKYLQNPARAQDATITVFEGLFEKLKKHEVQNFNKWVYVVSKNQCLMILRSDKKWKNKFVGEESLHLVKDELDFSDHKEEQIVELEKAIDSLNEEQKLCIELFYLKEMSYKEIVDLTGFEMNQVKSHIQNGKRNLKNQLSSKNEYEI